jgi:branched-chain amino acid transport system substrate-binding protein
MDVPNRFAISKGVNKEDRSMRTAATLVAAATVALSGAASAQDKISVGNLIDFTGRTAVVGKEYGQAKIDSAAWINAHGGINGKTLDLLTLDYSYEVPRAVAAYKKWRQQVVAVQGWGTGDTEAMVDFVAKDQIPYFSASYSAHLTDPTGKSPETKKAAPYNYPMGPSYSDGVRALIQWAAADWKQKGGQGTPKYVHMGDNHPYPNAPKKAGEEYAKELGFEVLPAIQYSLAPADFKAQCLSLQQSGANYAFLANTSGSNISLLKSCETVGVDVQFMANIWGYDENVMKAAGSAADGVVWVMGAAKWADDVPGMKLVQEVSQMSDPEGTKYRAVHYIRGVCSMFFMKEAMEWADAHGGIAGPNIKQAMYQKKDWVPAGLEGVCPPGSWSAQDHRGFTQAFVYRGRVTGATEGEEIPGLIKTGAIAMEKMYEANIPRKAEWLGW